MDTLADVLDASEQIALIDAARARRYDLLLGAGASLGAQNQHGVLPTSAELVAKLSVEYPSAHISPSDSLPRSYQRAVLAATPQVVREFLRRLFAEADHEPWFRQASLFPWRRVWTLNIDDSFERAYRAERSRRHPNLRVLSWDDAYVDSPTELNLIHLHGHVAGEAYRPIVFSFSEYMNTAAEKPVWDQVLGSLFSSNPFVVIGARLLDDPDMERIVMSRRSSAFARSLIVDPCITDGNKWELEIQGFKVLRATAEEFFAEWSSLCGFTSADPASYYMDVSARLPQLQYLHPERAAIPASSHDIFEGDSPVWSDAVAGNLASVDWADTCIDSIKQWRASFAPLLIALYGDRFSGMTAGLLQIAHGAAAQAVQVFSFDKSSRFDPVALMGLAQEGGPVLLVIDGAADFADDIDKALSQAELRGSRLAIIATEAHHNALRFEGRLEGAYAREVVQVPRRLSRKNAVSLAQLMQTKARMGEYEARGVDVLAKHFAHNDVFGAMLDVSKGSGFIRRVTAEFSQLRDWQKNLVFLLSLLSAGRLEAGLTEAQFAIGVNSERIIASLASDGHLSALVEQSDGLLSARQRDKAISEIVAKLGARDALARLVSMVTALKPLVTSASLQVRNRPALILGHLMGNRLLRANFPHEKLEAFYEALAPEFGEWNGKFWEQRAINAKKDGHWSRAESYAARAVTLFPATYTRTTYGTILINRAREAADDDSELWMGFLHRGQAQFDLVGSNADESRVSVFAYLTATLDLLKALKRRPSYWESEAVDSVRSDWVGRYALLRLGLRGQEASIDSIIRADKLSNDYEVLTHITPQLPGNIVDPVADQQQTLVPVVGTTHVGRVGKVLDYGYLVTLPPIGTARVTYKNQAKASGVPGFIPTLAVGDQIRVLVQRVKPEGQIDVVYVGRVN